MTENKNGIAKNWQNVKNQFANWQVEMVIATDKTVRAFKAGDYRRAAHHATGYLEETIQQLSKVWFYTWGAKWAFVAYLIWR